MRFSTRVLVVGTTSDYIDWIRNCSPGKTLFLTDPAVRRGSHEPCPTSAEEVLCNLSDYDRARRVLQQHLHHYDLHLSGVACYDCESMELAAVLAREFGLPYPSVQAVKNCRDKYISKVLWQKQGLHTPRAKQLRSADEATDFFHEIKGACVLKPLSGSGSELIFRCEDLRSCEQGFRDIRQGLQRRRENRLYKSFFSDNPVVLAEALVEGDEYSCDFILENGRATIIRLTRKIISSRGPFGTTLGYLLPADLPVSMNADDMLQTLALSAEALGLVRAVCMLDFIIHKNKMVLLELAPRPGGDCLPFLLRRCWNLDVLKLLLDFSRGRPLHVNRKSDSCSHIGLRLHACAGGTVKKIDAEQLRQDRRVVEIHLKTRPGQRIKMPPEDYDTWVLGHVIFNPDGRNDLQLQCRELLNKLIVEVE